MSDTQQTPAPPAHERPKRTKALINRQVLAEVDAPAPHPNAQKMGVGMFRVDGEIREMAVWAYLDVVWVNGGPGTPTAEDEAAELERLAQEAYAEPAPEAAGPALGSRPLSVAELAERARQEERERVAGDPLAALMGLRGQDAVPVDGRGQAAYLDRKPGSLVPEDAKTSALDLLASGVMDEAAAAPGAACTVRAPSLGEIAREREQAPKTFDDLLGEFESGKYDG